jgi:hypothetical protein
MTLRKHWFSSKVSSTEGYSVQLMDRGTLMYEEHRLIVYVGAELLAPKYTWAIYQNDMRIASRDGKQLDDEAMRKRIVERIGEVFAFQGLNLELS